MPSSHLIKSHLMESLSTSDDVILKEMHTKDKRIEALYIKTISDEKVIHQKVLVPFYEMKDSLQFLAYLGSHPAIKPFENQEKALEELLRGETILFYLDAVYLFDSKVERNNSVLETTVETTIQGPQSGFSESLPTNLGLIRQRYPEPTLQVESTTVGKLSKTKVMIVHDAKLADQCTLNRIKEFLAELEIQIFQTGEQLLDLIKKNNRALIPVMLVTERPERLFC